MSWKFIEIEAKYPELADIKAVHSASYIDFIAQTKGKGMTMLDSDTAATADTYDAAMLAAGGVIAAIDSVVAKKTDNAFALVRPPGHHATANDAAGFCIFNNIAIGAQHALDAHNMKRVLIVDWDVHHGNGTQKSFYDDGRVLYFSTHQSPEYPWSGAWGERGKGRGLGYTINVPMRAGADDAFYVRVFQEILVPVARSYRPELILVSAGFDPYVGDPIGGMKMSPEGFAALARIVLNLADECCDGRVVAVLEGGYNLQGLAKCVRAVLLEFLGETTVSQATLDNLAGSADLQRDRIIEQVREVQQTYWPALKG
jgi:acetoin utilization deacetylase AcuC-like enzyme